MEALSIFALSITMFLLGFIVIMLAIAGFCYFMRRIYKNKEMPPRLDKWIYFLDWTKEVKR